MWPAEGKMVLCFRLTRVSPATSADALIKGLVILQLQPLSLCPEIKKENTPSIQLWHDRPPRWCRFPSGKDEHREKREPQLQGDHYQTGTKIGFILCCLEEEQIIKIIKKWPPMTDPRKLTCGSPLRQDDEKKKNLSVFVRFFCVWLARTPENRGRALRQRFWILAGAFRKVVWQLKHFISSCATCSLQWFVRWYCAKGRNSHQADNNSGFSPTLTSAYICTIANNLCVYMKSAKFRVDLTVQPRHEWKSRWCSFIYFWWAGLK